MWLNKLWNIWWSGLSPSSILLGSLQMQVHLVDLWVDGEDAPEIEESMYFFCFAFSLSFLFSLFSFFLYVVPIFLPPVVVSSFLSFLLHSFVIHSICHSFEVSCQHLIILKTLHFLLFSQHLPHMQNVFMVEPQFMTKMIQMKWWERWLLRPCILLWTITSTPLPWPQVLQPLAHKMVRARHNVCSFHLGLEWCRVNCTG